MDIVFPGNTVSTIKRGLMDEKANNIFGNGTEQI